MISLNTVLVPTDFSEPSAKAVKYGVELAAKFGAELHLFHAYETTPILYGEGGYYPADAESQIEAAALKELNELSIVGAEDLSVVRNISCGPPFVEIIRYAKDHTVDLIVMGTHGRGPIAHMLLGSVAEKVVRKAPCPVLVVREQEHEFVMP